MNRRNIPYNKFFLNLMHWVRMEGVAKRGPEHSYLIEIVNPVNELP